MGSAEILERQLFSERLVHGFNCLAVRDVHNAEELASVIRTVLNHPERAEQIGRRGLQYSAETENLRDFPDNYEALFSEVIEGKSAAGRRIPLKDEAEDELSWTRRVVESLPEDKREDIVQFAMPYGSGPSWGLAVYTRLLQLVDEGELGSGVLLEAVRLELQLSGILNGEEGSQVAADSALFRLDAGKVINFDKEFPSLYAEAVPGLKIEEYNYDLGELLAARSRGDLPIWVRRRSSHAAILPGSEGGRCRVIFLSPAMCYLLSLCDGTLTITELLTKVATAVPSLTGIDEVNEAVVDCFRLGLVRLISEPVLFTARQVSEER